MTQNQKLQKKQIAKQKNLDQQEQQQLLNVPIKQKQNYAQTVKDIKLKENKIQEISQNQKENQCSRDYELDIHAEKQSDTNNQDYQGDYEYQYQLDNSYDKNKSFSSHKQKQKSLSNLQPKVKIQNQNQEPISNQDQNVQEQFHHQNSTKIQVQLKNKFNKNSGKRPQQSKSIQKQYGFKHLEQDDLMDMIDGIKNKQDKKQQKIIKEILQKQINSYMTQKEKEIYDKYDLIMLEKTHEAKIYSQRNVADGESTMPQSEQQNPKSKIQEQSYYQPANNFPLNHQNFKDVQVLRNNIIRYNSKFRTGDEYQDDSTPLYKLHVCKCGATFTTYGILNLHIDKKHDSDRSFIVRFYDSDPNSTRTVKLEENLGISPLTMQKKHLNQYQRFQCKCGRVLGSYRALKIHIKWQHQEDPQYADNQAVALPHVQQFYKQNYSNGTPPPSVNQIFYCGCGKKYTCSSALNFHIRTKHGWQAPQGTIGGYGGYAQIVTKGFKPTSNNKPQDQDQISTTSKRYNQYNYDQNNYDQNDQSYEPSPQPQRYVKKQSLNPQTANRNQKEYFCGCGGFYSCTSALYLHIRQKHNGIPPAGTKGGPGIQVMMARVLSKRKSLQQFSKDQDRDNCCCLCKTTAFQECRFECLICPNHYLCKKCFFKRDSIKGEHEWKVKQLRPKRRSSSYSQKQQYDDYYTQD